MIFKEVLITLLISHFFSMLTAEAVLVVDFFTEQIKKTKYEELVDRLSTSWEDEQ